MNFATGDKHVNLPQTSDAQCTQCHVPNDGGVLNASITGAHVVLNNTAAVKGQLTPDTPGVNFEILAVEDAVAGKKAIAAKSTHMKALLRLAEEAASEEGREGVHQPEMAG